MTCLFQTDHCAAGGRGMGRGKGRGRGRERRRMRGGEEEGRMEWVAKEMKPHQTLGETCDE